MTGNPGGNAEGRSGLQEAGCALQGVGGALQLWAVGRLYKAWLPHALCRCHHCLSFPRVNTSAMGGGDQVSSVARVSTFKRTPTAPPMTGPRGPAAALAEDILSPVLPAQCTMGTHPYIVLRAGAHAVNLTWVTTSCVPLMRPGVKAFT